MAAADIFGGVDADRGVVFIADRVSSDDTAAVAAAPAPMEAAADVSSMVVSMPGVGMSGA